MTRYLVIGGGPCGIAVCGRLLDLKAKQTVGKVIWIDPMFQTGRMGKYYKNVIANTPTGDLVNAFHLCESFDFSYTQSLRRQRHVYRSPIDIEKDIDVCIDGRDEDIDRCIDRYIDIDEGIDSTPSQSTRSAVLSDLNPSQCFNLEYFVDALDDSTQVLKRKVDDLIIGKVLRVNYLTKDSVWRVTAQGKYDKRERLDDIDINEDSERAIDRYTDRDVDVDGLSSTLDRPSSTLDGLSSTLDEGNRSSDLHLTLNATTSPVTDTKIDALIDFDVEVVILACGSIPLMLNMSRPSSPRGDHDKPVIHSLDEVVDVYKLKKVLIESGNDGSRWCVVGTSHSAMLILMNLYKLGIRNIINIYKSEALRYEHYTDDGVRRYPGIGLKGPVGDWVRQHYHLSTITRVRYQPEFSWHEHFRQYNITDAVFAIGFENLYHPNNTSESSSDVRSDNSSSLEVKVKSLQDEITFPHVLNDGVTVSKEILQRYDINTGEISKFGSLFGAGIAYPQHHFYPDGTSEPWVGFKRSIEQVDLMIQTYENSIRSKRIH